MTGSNDIFEGEIRLSDWLPTQARTNVAIASRFTESWFSISSNRPLEVTLVNVGHLKPGDDEYPAIRYDLEC